MFSEYLLAAAVVVSIIIFGGLITRGNDRVRRSVDVLHESYKKWAMHDLRIKRGVAGSGIKIDDITAWLKKVTTKAFGYDTFVVEYYRHSSGPAVSVEFHEAGNGKTIVCTLQSPAELRQALKKKQPTIAGDIRPNPIYRIGKKTPSLELSMLNAGMLFDLELPIAWNIIAGEQTDAETLWVHILD